jgi:methyl-accepting chemotaxis protein
MSFRNRLWLLVGVFATGFVVATIFSFSTLNHVKVNGPIYQEIVQQKDLLADILPPPEYLVESYLVSLQMVSADRGAQGPLIEKAKALAKDFEDRHQYWQQALPAGETKTLLVERAYKPGAEMLALQQRELIPALQRGDVRAAEAALVQVASKYNEHRAVIDQLVKLAVANAAEQEAVAAATVKRESIFSLALAGVFLVLGMAVSVWILRVVMRQLGGDPAYAATVAKVIAEGDLSCRIETSPADDSSLLAAMKRMQGALHEVIARINEAAVRSEAAAQALATTAQQVSQSSNQQSDSAAQIAASIEELTASVNQVSDSAKTAHALADEARRLSIDAATHVHETVGEMNTIAGSVESSAGVVRQLGEQSQRISGIVGVIREIADQTNLLALNAAIEAARAGEQGRGFAVVADEVRKLAEKTATSTQEISTMIGEMQNGTQTAVKQMEAGSTQVGKGVEVAHATGSAMSSIEAGAGKVLTAVDEISSALREQAAASNQISTGIETIAQMTEENSAAVGALSQAAAALQQLAGGLRTEVGRFRL